VFLKIQEEALDAIAGARESIADACKFLYASGLGWGFSLRFILEQLGKFGIDLKKRPEVARIDDDAADPYDPEMRVLNDDFILSTLKFAEFHALREIKHRARIPVKDSYVLVGVADEGPEYRKRSRKIGMTRLSSVWRATTCLVGL
jgi:RNA-dependent RNA polymerase